MSDNALAAGKRQPLPDTQAPAPEPEQLTTADGKPLHVALRRAESRARRRAFFLVLPLLLFLVVTFAIPIGQMMARSVQNPEVSQYLPNVSEVIGEWDGESVPGEEVFAALAEDMRVGLEERTIGRVAARINREIPGTRSMMMGTARDIDEMTPPWREAFLAADEGWGNVEFWRLVQRETRTITPVYYLLAFDYEYSSTGEIVPRPEAYQAGPLLASGGTGDELWLS